MSPYPDTAEWNGVLMAVVSAQRGQLGVATSKEAQSAMCALVAVSSRPLLRRVRQVQRDVHEAEDVLQEVYLKVWLHGRLFDPARGSARRWLTTLAHHAAVDSLRRNTALPGANPRRAGGGEPGDDEADACAGVVCPAPGAFEQLAATRQRQAVLHSLRQLPPQRRQLLHLTLYDGMTQAQLAAHLGQPLGSVKSMLRRSYRSLKPMLAAHW